MTLGPMTQGAEPVTWQLTEVSSPGLLHPVPVVAAYNIPYLPDANRFQNLTIYLPKTSESSSLVGTPASSLPDAGTPAELPRYQVHIHGGAWRDPGLTSASIEPTVAHAFSGDPSMPILAIASINYSVSPFPTHPSLPYDAVKDDHSDVAREAVHPEHVRDVLHGLAILRSFGLTDQSYLLSGHSCGACLSLQALLQHPRAYGLADVGEAPRPAALLGLNGLYDLPALVNGLGASHEHLRSEYETLLSQAFGPAQGTWPAASPARFAPAEIAERVREGKAPRLVVLDQSTEDQLVPMNQRDRLEANLSTVSGLQVVQGHRCTGLHAAPWELGVPIWQSVQDILRLLQEQR